MKNLSGKILYEINRNKSINNKMLKESKDLNTKFRGNAQKLADEYADEIAKKYHEIKSKEDLKNIARTQIYQLINSLSYNFNDKDAVKMVHQADHNHKVKDN